MRTLERIRQAKLCSRRLLINLMGVHREGRFDFKKKNLFREIMGADHAHGKKCRLFGGLALKARRDDRWAGSSRGCL